MEAAEAYGAMIAIHAKSGEFALEWLAYCEAHDVPFKVVDCFASDIIDQLRGCQALLWHWEHHDYRAALFARQLTASVEAMGLIVFPSTATAWHYDDKVGQKYLLEAFGAPLVPSYAFYDRRIALDWIHRARFPLVWKLRSGAGSQNVQLVHDRETARRIINRSFGRGWKPARLHAFRERIWQFRKAPSISGFLNIGRGLARAVVPHEKHRNAPTERHYVYFQDFIPNNDSDIRIVVVGARAFAIKRMIRDGDFRASGSGHLIYEPSVIPAECVALAFGLTQRLGSQSLAFDFMIKEGAPVIGEISYAFAPKAYLPCPGWWDPNLTWHPGQFQPASFMIKDLLAALRSVGSQHV